jgi:hypothetical protein
LISKQQTANISKNFESTRRGKDRHEKNKSAKIRLLKTIKKQTF